MASQDPDHATGLTHLDAKGHARMVDVGDKAVTTREATAQARVVMLPETMALLRSGDAPKGDVLATARIAGIQAAKKTWDLIPLCHPLPLSGCKVTLTPRDVAPDATEAVLDIETWVRCSHKTGVEMEALTAASVAALTVYDMLKAVDRGMRIEGVALLEKKGGRSGDWTREG